MKSEGVQLALALSSALWGLQFVEFRRLELRSRGAAELGLRKDTEKNNVDWDFIVIQWDLLGCTLSQNQHFAKFVIENGRT